MNLPADDQGFGIIKPSGGEQTVAIIDGDRILIESKDKVVKFYEYRLWTDPQARELKNDAAADALRRKLDAYLQTATQSLLDNTTGLVPKTRRRESE